MMALRHAIRRSALAALLAGLSHAAAAQLPVETLTAEPAIPADSSPLYIPDIAINHISDGKLHVVNGKTGAYLGVIGTGFTGQSKLSRDGSEVFIATGYYDRGQRGNRTDIVEVWDARTLRFKHEIALTDKRAMALNYKYLLSQLGDRWLVVQNATPATSVQVIDLVARKNLGEISMPGCWAIYPVQSQSSKFGALCGDGTVQLVTLDDNGGAARRTVSEVLFDPDGDALFVQGEPTGDVYHFVSFTGNVVSIDLGGDKAVKVDTWSLVSPAERKKGWRPGGYQPLALHQGNGRLYVTMHGGGGEGSHKTPAQSIWVFDIATKKRVAKLPGHMATAIAISSNGDTLYAIDAEKASLVITDLSGKKPKVSASAQVGEFPSQIELR
jgi:methylamine dehydrogenase heavy chain